jgi:hypothetical protein
MNMGITGYLLVSSTGSGSRRLLPAAALAFLPEVPEAAGAAAGAGEGGMTRRRNAGPGLWLLRYQSVSVSHSHCSALNINSTTRSKHTAKELSK